MGRRANYRQEEVRRLVEEYADLKAKADTSTMRGALRALISLADLDRALERLPLKYWEVVLLHGLLRIPQEGTAKLLQVTQQAVAKRYRHGLEEIHYLINGCGA
jgi:DNA-directed RNA polymerase specialized sigma24 family protein